MNENVKSPLQGEAQPEGVDVSNHQGTVNWAQVKAGGIEFAFIKATEGTTFLDPYFHSNWAGAGGAGILRGAYHYFRPTLSPEAQARHFLEVVPRLGQGDLHPVLDIEEWDGIGPGPIGDGVQVWVDTVKAALGRDVIIYTYPYFWTRRMANTRRFAQNCPLWIAAYPGPPRQPLVGGWPFYTFHQYTDQGSTPGCPHVDRNRFNGTEANLRKFAGY